MCLVTLWGIRLQGLYLDGFGSAHMGKMSCTFAPVAGFSCCRASFRAVLIPTSRTFGIDKYFRGTISCRLLLCSVECLLPLRDAPVG